MSEQTDDAEKEHAPTQRRLDEARKRGEVARAPELSAAAAYAGLLLAAMAFGGPALRKIGDAGSVLLSRPDRLADLFVRGAHAPAGGLMGTVLIAAAPVFLLPAAAVVLSVVAQRAVTFAPDKLMPKLSRLSPLANAKNKFGPDGLFEFAKSFVKLVIVGVALALFLSSRMNEIVGTLYLAPAQSVVVLLRLLLRFLFVVVAMSVVLGAIDYLWQHFAHLRRHRMSRKELTDEMKDTEGDPHAKSQRRQRGQEIALNQMLTEVPNADVVIVNPTHYAVALKWSPGSGRAPVCLAKGVDEIAARIREAASEAGVPLHSDPPTARALHATIEIGQEILPEHYRPVAAAIRFAEAMRKRARQGAFQ